MEISDFCKNLPKIELHAHLNGSLSETTLKSLGCFPEKISEFHKLTKLLSRTEKTLQDCFPLFAIAQKATSTPNNVYQSTRDVIKEFREDNTIYLELRTTPRAENNMSKQEYVQAVIDGIRDEQEGINVKLILCINREHDNLASEESMDLIIRMQQLYPEIITGVDLCGNPSVGKFNRDLFKQARDNGLKITLHCGEVRNSNEVMEMLDFQPDRIGHATYLHPQFGGCEEAWHLYQHKPIPLECCLTSNVVCGTAKSYTDHHIKQWIEHSLPFTLNTDDKGVFCTSLSKEYEICAKNYQLETSKLWQIAYNSIEYSFASQEEKNQLKEMMKKWKLKHYN